MALGEHVLVEEDLLVGHGAPSDTDGGRGRVASGPVDGEPAVDGVVAALDGALVVPPRPLADRHAQVGLDDAGLHLGEQLLAQAGEMGRLAAR